MIFRETVLAGTFLLESEPHADARGTFARTFCRREFQAHGLDAEVAQCSLSSNHRRGTLRGLHFQQPPAAEAKLVRCLRGSLFDVVVDLRRDSVTHRQWFAVELREGDGKSIYIPQGMAHGYLTLQDNTELWYQVSTFHEPALADGVRWNDPAFAIAWPFAPAILSDRDAGYPDYAP